MGASDLASVKVWAPPRGHEAGAAAQVVGGAADAGHCAGGGNGGVVDTHHVVRCRCRLGRRLQRRRSRRQRLRCRGSPTNSTAPPPAGGRPSHRGAWCHQPRPHRRRASPVRQREWSQPARCGADERQRLEQHCRYNARPALASERVQCNAAGKVILKPKTLWHDDTTHLVTSPLQSMPAAGGRRAASANALPSAEFPPLKDSFVAPNRGAFQNHKLAQHRLNEICLGGCPLPVSARVGASAGSRFEPPHFTYRTFMVAKSMAHKKSGRTPALAVDSVAAASVDLPPKTPVRRPVPSPCG